MEPRQEKAFEFAAELCKQLITLSTALIGLTITFWKDVVGTNQVHAKWLAYWSWYAFLASALFGIWMLMALTGVLEPTNAAKRGPPSIRGLNVVLPSALQILSFLAGLALLVVFARLNY
jgi:hypothetical protein